ncbi:MAG: hypothetical protein RI907_2494 [Pseudomonadota bacterium]|jgi:hypothetical protein
MTLAFRLRHPASLAVALLWAGQGAWAAPGIYTCTDSSGRRFTSDRPIAECLDREQRLLNKDGSQNKVVPPRMTAEERAAAEERKHQAELAEAARKDAVRRDRNLVMRYPDEAAHDKARESVLDDLRRSIEASERHLKTLEEERKPLEAETEFYKNKRLPPKLKAKLDANEAQQKAQRDIIATQRSEMVRVDGLYDAELARLKKLWAGAAPGSVPDSHVGKPSSAP